MSNLIQVVGNDVDLKGAISRRINKQHRFVYQALENEQAIKVIMMWTHDE